MLAPNLGRIIYRLLFALLLLAAVGIAPVALQETTDLALTPSALACGSQGGGC